MPVRRKRQDHPEVLSIENFTTWTNQKGYLSNAGPGGSIYHKWKPFSVEEIQQHLGTYILNGLSPAPQIQMKFRSASIDPVNGNDYVANALGVNATRRHQEFKAFFAAADPLLPTPSRKSHPNWKVQKLFKWAHYISKKCVFIGRNISCDEQTIGCQGRHPDILRINYKKEGDGFQCDAICADGYTYCFYFRNQSAPKCFIEQGMCPLHARVHSLWDQLPGKNYTCAMDNLYMSTKLCRSAWRCKQQVMAYGVVRSKNRGVPCCVQQDVVTKKAELEQVRGTLKVAHLKGDDKIKGLICISFYDSKPFYMLSNACESIEWIRKNRSIWRKDEQRMVNTTFLRLNIINEYNINMNNVDIADQLRGSYRFDKFICKTKWWWSMYFWCLQMLMTNAYVLYKKYMLLHDVKPLSHYDFRKEIALAWIRPDLHNQKKTTKRKRIEPRSIDTSEQTVSTSTRSATKKLKLHTPFVQNNITSKRATGFTDKTLHPVHGHLKIRLSEGNHWPAQCQKTDARCQLHYWVTDKKTRSQLLFVLNVM